MNLYQFATALLILSASTGAAPSPGGGVSRFNDDAPLSVHGLDVHMHNERAMHAESFPEQNDHEAHGQATGREKFTLREALLYDSMFSDASDVDLFELSEESSKESLVEITPPRMHIGRKFQAMLKKALPGNAVSRIGPTLMAPENQQDDAYLNIQRLRDVLIDNGIQDDAA